MKDVTQTPEYTCSAALSSSIFQAFMLNYIACFWLGHFGLWRPVPICAYWLVCMLTGSSHHSFSRRLICVSFWLTWLTGWFMR